jgi:hypothetical protein
MIERVRRPGSLLLVAVAAAACVPRAAAAQDTACTHAR